MHGGVLGPWLDYTVNGLIIGNIYALTNGNSGAIAIYNSDFRAIDTGGSNQRSVRFAGRGLDDSNFSYDGVDETSIINQTQRPWARLSIPLDAIAEFRVDTLLPTAQGGSTGGAQLAVISPSGSNRFHGRLFEYLRNDAFDAPDQPAGS